MSYLVNNPADFVDESIDGFVAANHDLVRRVPGGVVRATRTRPGEVAVVIGGGSGHYPAFAGLVGQGLAHGAAMGNVFASPSAQQIYSVAKAAASDAGVILSFGNYAGDVLNFGIAAERLNAEGITCRCLAVTDDICSGPAEDPAQRRGIAGDLMVFRALSIAAERGDSFDEVYAFGERANDLTRSFGVAFSGCTLPGASEPLFTVPAGRMGVGMGIHGEQGIEEVDLPRADELGMMLVDRLLGERPGEPGKAASPRVGVMLNGLGAVKYEELFVLYKSVSKRLEAAGLTIVNPEVGELVTSFEMAGVSLTLFWLDAEMEAVWTAAAITPAYTRSEAIATGTPRDDSDIEAAVDDSAPEASAESKADAQGMLAVIEAIHAKIDVEADGLGKLDAISGDGDHGIGMQTGASAALAAARRAVEKGCGAGSVLSRAGDAWANEAGGTSGALWGLGLRRVGECIGDAEHAKAPVVADGVAEATDAITRLGGASLGDKTLFDAMKPFADALSAEVETGKPLREAWRQAAEVSEQSAEATAKLEPKLGRAKNHSDKSVGHPDPGAISFAMIVNAIADTLDSLHEDAS
ncbi:dihydroxyacetone kinase family protein [Salinisphaera sp. Q1T1-3]|uniref:dihydroxyacetone kinase family protein n=1 Tax=Salinisphaera sp. Q1T1-3 TaxID=2321229 RepID=UPI000E74A694|nr:dihydroxyacetone kinase family protein [Salinisphaera sp. Q1T1-3]RJS93506.1 dihydroxyacetone kinase family protein [Salinisphaera sp. Q1T1-3]